ncbi:hypothetical protein VTG60DRAFT_2172 [Thermothelomyces hinnuleus]
MCLPSLGSMLLSIQGPDIELRRTRTSLSYTWRGMRIMHSMNPTIVHIGDGVNDIFHIEDEPENGHAVGNGAWIQPTYNLTVERRDVGGIAGLLRAVRNVFRAAMQRVRQLGAAAVERCLDLRRNLAALSPVGWCILLFLNILLVPLALTGVTILFWLAIVWLVLYGVYEVTDRVAYLTARLLDGPVETAIAIIWNMARSGQAYLIREVASAEPQSSPSSPAQQPPDRQPQDQQPHQQLSGQQSPGMQPDQQGSGQHILGQHIPSQQQAPGQQPLDQQALDQHVPDQQASGQQAPGQPLLDRQAANQQAPNQQALNQQAPVQQSVRQQAVEEGPTEQQAPVQQPEGQQAQG